MKNDVYEVAKNKIYIPRICFMSHYRLRAFSEPIVAEYSARAQIELIEGSFDQALALAKQRIEKNQVDVFLSAGSNAGILRQSIVTPIVSIHISGYDLMQALIHAKTLSPHVGIVTYGDSIPSLHDIKSLLVLQLTQYHYKTPEDARACIQKLKAKGIEVVLGSSIIVDLAEKAGMHGILAYSLESIRSAFDQALEVGRIAHLEATRFQQLNSVLQTLPEAVVAVNAQEQIIAINQAMQKILCKNNVDLRGQVLSNIQPELSLLETLNSGEIHPPSALQIANSNWVSHRTPIFDNETVVGAALTLHDATTIFTADTKLRIFERSRQFTARHHFDQTILGNSPALKDVIQRAKGFASSMFDILILGESGTGKELFAQAIHNASARSNQPFIAINCAAFPESLIESELFGHDDGAFTGSKRGGRRGLIESAHKGTLFLDEIGDMPLSLQTRLLRVLQEREITRLGSNTALPIDIRVIAATHQPLDLLVAQKQFRQDLYFRLNVLQLRLPPLRERIGDIFELFMIFLNAHFAFAAKKNRLAKIQAELEIRLNQYSWPGNIRELESMAKRLSVVLQNMSEPLTSSLLAQELPELFRKHDAHPAQVTTVLDAPTTAAFVTEPTTLAEFQNLASRYEKAHYAMSMTQGNHLEAAALLKISRTTLWRWLKKV